MNLLFTGRGTSGSWQVRGVQLGQACKAKVRARASMSHIMAADVVVVVKRVTPEILVALRHTGKPWVLDCVDFYPQPVCTDWSREDSIAWVREKIRALRPTAVIWPNERMRQDCDTGIPGMVLPHHHRPGIEVNPVREQVQAVGYEGSPSYVGEWIQPIVGACATRGWRFHVNPQSLADVDIVIACRGAEFNGYAQRHWKSGVKLANAHGSGTPFVGPQECGYLETSTGLELWADDVSAIGECFGRLACQSTRQAIHDAFIAHRYGVDKAAGDLVEFLRQWA